jgi:hypothetical protein
MCDARWVPLKEQVMLTTQTYTRRHLLAPAAAFLIAPLLAPAASAQSVPRAPANDSRRGKRAVGKWRWKQSCR